MVFLNSIHLKYKILFLFSFLTTIIILIMGIISYRISVAATQKIVIGYVQDMLLQVKINLDSNMEEMDRIVNSLLLDKNFCASIRNPPSEKFKKVQLKNFAENRLRSISRVKNDIGNMYILTDEGDLYTNNIATT